MALDFAMESSLLAMLFRLVVLLAGLEQAMRRMMVRFVVLVVLRAVPVLAVVGRPAVA